ncbi:MAG: hypothetical protein O6913_05840 [Chloroflexi bacterium]|nr:hypothetical protein [Chloroflexota bacterium]
MTSRAGSLIVAVFLGGFSLVTVILIVILTGGDGDQDGSALLGTSLRDGDVVLLGEPIEIRISARDDEPVVRFALLVDGTLITQTVADDADDSGTFSGSLSWIPDRLGVVTLTVEAQSISGATTTREIRVEVSDSLQRVRAALRLTVVSPSALQRLPVTRPVGILVRAESDDPVTRLELELNGITLESVLVQPEESGDSLFSLSYTPSGEGIVTLRIRAFTAGGNEGVTELTVEFVPDELAPGEEEDESPDEVSGENGILVIRNPSDLEEIDFEAGLTIEIEIEAFDTGLLQSIELYVNTLLTQSVSAEPFADGSYRVVLPFNPGAPGAYTVEVVAISTRNLRFDARVDITLREPQDEEPPPDEEQEDPADRPQPDLIVFGLAVGESNTVVVTVQNVGQEPVGPVQILITVIRTADSLLLAEEIIPLVLGPGEGRLVQLELGLTDTIDITVIVDTANTVDEANEDNNTLSGVFEPLSRPDLVAQELEISEDGLPIVSLVNAGSDVANGPIAVVILFNGVAVERLSVPQDLPSQGTLTLAGSIVLEGGGQLSAIVDPDNAIAEADETNNTITIEIAP